MASGKYWQGQTVELRAMFLGMDGVALVATGVAFRVKRPDGTFLTVAAQPDQLRPNEWLAYVVADQAGTWTVRASCATPRAAVEQSTFSVMASLPG
jgi:hypothetical protein